MNLLTIEHLTKSYTERLLFDDTAFSINEGEKVGLIGINGTGKSTLLRIAAGLEQPDEGSVVKGRSLYIRYLPQIPEFTPGDTILDSIVRDNKNEPHFSSVEELKASAKTMLNRLEIEDFDAKVETLSGGQRKRVALASVLLSTADLLILDEPTNHLDSQMADWLEGYLKAFKGALLMITHDRYFLDSVTNRIVELDKGKLYSYQGGYEKYLELKAERLSMAEAAERKRQSILRTEIAWMQRGARARSTKQKAHIQRYEQLRDQEGPEYDRNVQLESIGSRLGRTTVELKDICKSYGDKVLMRDFNYVFLKNDRIGIIGPNGSGKSTLVNLLARFYDATDGQIRIGGHDIRSYSREELRGKIGMVMQKAQLFSGTIRSNLLWGNPGATDEMLWAALETAQAAEFVQKKEKQLDEPVEQGGRNLSGGQKQRVAIARALANDPNVLLCDEATSALDPQTTKAILQLLKHLNETLGITVVIITHEMAVVKEICHRVAVMEHGKVVESGEVFNIFANPREDITKNFIHTTSNLRKIEELIAEDSPVVKLNPGELIVRLSYIQRNVSEPLISTVSRKFDIVLNIIFSDIAIVQNAPIGGTVAIISGGRDQITQAIAYLSEKNVGVEVIKDARVSE